MSLILKGKLKGIKKKGNGKGHKIYVDDGGMFPKVVHVKEDEVKQYQSKKQGDEIEMPVYVYSFEETKSVHYGLNQSF